MWEVLRRDVGEFVTVLKEEVTTLAEGAASLVESSQKKTHAAQDLQALRSDAETYTEALELEEGSDKPFEGVMEEHKEMIADLKEDEIVARMYSELVEGDKVKEELFWGRYLHREKLARRPDLSAYHTEDDEEGGWGDEEEDHSDGNDARPAVAMASASEQEVATCRKEIAQLKEALAEAQTKAQGAVGIEKELEGLKEEVKHLRAENTALQSELEQFRLPLPPSPVEGMPEDVARPGAVVVPAGEEEEWEDWNEDEDLGEA